MIMLDSSLSLWSEAAPATRQWTLVCGCQKAVRGNPVSLVHMVESSELVVIHPSEVPNLLLLLQGVLTHLTPCLGLNLLEPSPYFLLQCNAKISSHWPIAEIRVLHCCAVICEL